MYFRTRVQIPAPPPFFPMKLGVLAQFSRRLHDSSTRVLAIEQADGGVERRRTQVHVPLRRPEILMAGEFLNRPSRSAAHREVRTERVPKDMQSRPHVRSSRDASHHHLNHFLRERLALVIAEHPRPSQMPSRLQGSPRRAAMRFFGTPARHRRSTSVISTILTSRYIQGLPPRANARDWRPLSRGQTRGERFWKSLSSEGERFWKSPHAGVHRFWKPTNLNVDTVPVHREAFWSTDTDWTPRWCAYRRLATSPRRREWLFDVADTMGSQIVS